LIEKDEGAQEIGKALDVHLYRPDDIACHTFQLW
jgi:hypothetical protein